MLFVLLFVLLMIVWLRVNYPLRFKMLYETVVNVRILRQKMNEESANVHRSTIIFTSIFLVTFSLYLFLLSKSFGLELFGNNSLVAFLKIIAIVISAYTIKFIGITIINTIVDADFGLLEYRFSVLQLSNAVGILLLPIVLISAYISQSTSWYCLILGAIIILSLFLFRIIRGVINSVQHQAPVFYIILYLCTLEILPIVLIVKVLFY